MALNTSCVGMEKRTLFLCMWNRICFYWHCYFSRDVYVFYNGAGLEVVFQNRQVMWDVVIGIAWERGAGGGGVPPES